MSQVQIFDKTFTIILCTYCYTYFDCYIHISATVLSNLLQVPFVVLSNLWKIRNSTLYLNHGVDCSHSTVYALGVLHIHFLKITQYKKMHLKKAGEYIDQNIVSIATKMSTAVHNM